MNFLSKKDDVDRSKKDEVDIEISESDIETEISRITGGLPPRSVLFTLKLSFIEPNAHDDVNFIILPGIYSQDEKQIRPYEGNINDKH